MAQRTEPPNPPPSTRSSTRKATFDRVIKDVMGIDSNDLLLKALDSNGLDSIYDILTLTDTQIDTLSFNDGTAVMVPSLASRNKLRILRSWNFHLQQVQGNRCVDWMDPITVTEDEWDDFRVGIYIVPSDIPPNPDITSVGVPSTPSIRPAATTFLSSFHNRHSNVGPRQANIMGQQQFDNYNKEDGDKYGETKIGIEDDYFGLVNVGITRPQGRGLSECVESSRIEGVVK